MLYNVVENLKLSKNAEHRQVPYSTIIYCVYIVQHLKVVAELPASKKRSNRGIEAFFSLFAGTLRDRKLVEKSKGKLSRNTKFDRGKLTPVT